MTQVPVITDLMERLDDIQQYADPRTRKWFMLFGNPIPVWTLTAMYLIFVLFAGPKLMQNRKAFSLQYFMVVYNLGLVALSVYMFAEMLLSTKAAGYNWLCSPYNKETIKDPRELRVANVLWWYAFSKAIELMDTVLMVLRKKNNQISFLHIFHHATMLNIWWWVPTFIPGGQTWFGACLNCLVHVVMYSYYGLAAIPSLRDKLWWKRYITTFQLVQFVITFIHSAQTYVTGCDFPLWGQYLLMGYMLIMLCLFGNFYIKSYIVGKRKRDSEKKGKMESESYSNGHVTEKNGNVTEKNGTVTGRKRVVTEENGFHVKSNGLSEKP